MRNNVSIEVIDLLHQREAEFIRVWECEQKIKEMLPDFPIPPPPDLPSRQKRVKPSAKKPPQSEETPASKASQAIRKLVPGEENAYRLVFLYNNEQQSSFQQDRELVRTLVNVKTTDFTILSVETVSFQDAEHWTTIETLYQA
ncbi:MAG: hypothetical protein IJT83_11885 [Victivallales bacterium]|nr:hypothetical protein [Victivallales bacterium]